MATQRELDILEKRLNENEKVVLASIVARYGNLLLQSSIEIGDVEAEVASELFRQSKKIKKVKRNEAHQVLNKSTKFTSDNKPVGWDER